MFPIDMSGDSRYMRGISLLNAGRLEEALTEFESLSVSDPQDPQSHFYMGITFYRMDRVEGGIAKMDEAIALDLDYAEAYFGRAQMYVSIKGFEEALNDYASALNVASDFNVVVRDLIYCEMGITKYYAKQFCEAIVDFGRAIKQNKKNGKAYLWRGKTRIKVADYKKAVEDFNRYIHLTSHDICVIEGYQLRAMVNMCLGQQTDAIKDFDHVLLSMPENLVMFLMREIAVKNAGQQIKDKYLKNGGAHEESKQPKNGSRDRKE